MEKFSELIFSDDFKRYIKDDDRLEYVPKSLNKSALLSHLSKALNFPDYFGENWDALYDCLSSMQISEPRVALIHEALPDLDDKNLSIYLNILNDIVKLKKETIDKRTYPELIVIFPYISLERVRALASK